MRRNILIVIISISILQMNAQSWQPAGDKIKTPWAEQVNPSNPLPEYPRPQLVREHWLSLNGLWDYAIKDCGNITPTSFDGKILVPFPIESSLSGVMKSVSENQELWYHRTFTFPESWKNKNILLNFGAADWQTDVWVNDIKVGTHKGGYTPFSFNITPYLAKNGQQKIAVKVWDPTDKGFQPRGKQVSDPGGIWYTPVTGIW